MQPRRGTAGSACHPLGMLVRPGVDVQRVIETLSRTIVEAHNSHTGDDEGYVKWVLDLDPLFGEWFTDVPPTLLYSERFWRIRSDGGHRPHELRRNELARVVAMLSSLRDSLKEMVARFGTPARTIAVLDTNVLLHHKPLTDIQWTEVIGAPQVTLVIPIRVLAEIDEKKAAPNNRKLRDRARTRINMLEPFVLGDGGVSRVREGVEVTAVGSVDLDPGARRRRPAAPDVEILDTCLALSAYAAKNAVFLVTGDLSMKISTKLTGVAARSMCAGDYQPLGGEE